MKDLKFCTLLILLIVNCMSSHSMSSEPELTSSHEVMTASNDINGYHIAAATDIKGKSHDGDFSISQIYEIIRPNMEAFSVDRLAVSCDCLKLTMTKKNFAAGERAFLEICNIKPTPPEGATYIVFVKLETPINEVLQHLVFVKSGDQ